MKKWTVVVIDNGRVGGVVEGRSQPAGAINAKIYLGGHPRSG